MIIFIEHANTLKKSANLSNAFVVKNTITSTKFVVTTSNVIFARTNIFLTNAEQ